jgi:hypothetical protein
LSTPQEAFVETCLLLGGLDARSGKEGKESEAVEAPEDCAADSDLGSERDCGIHASFLSGAITYFIPSSRMPSGLSRFVAVELVRHALG